MDNETWKAKLKEAGYMGYVPEESSKPDVPVVIPGEKPNVYSGFLVLCANQCRRDAKHCCTVEVGYANLFGITDDMWEELVCEKIPWMILKWGPHEHTLPFCCSSCLIEFVQERTARSETAHEHSHEH